MKRLKRKIEIGDEVNILEGMYEGEWGTVKDFDGEVYHVAIWNDPNALLIFEPDEIEFYR